MSGGVEKGVEGVEVDARGPATRRPSGRAEYRCLLSFWARSQNHGARMSIDPLIVDVYHDDGPKDWKALAAAGPPWHGAILKATQGTYYNSAAWFDANWRQVREAGSD